jgi:hypothetical protein
VVAAITGLSRHPNGVVRAAAEKALAQWSADYKRKTELNKAYKGPAFIRQPSEHQVTAATPLQVGQIVAEIKRVLPDGRVEVKFRGWPASRDKAIDRSHMRLAHDEVDQPNLSGVELAAVRGESFPTTRNWTDSTGKFSVHAEFVKLADGKVVLRRVQDGREVAVPLAKLSAADQAAAQQLSTQPAKGENPFEP